LIATVARHVEIEPSGVVINVAQDGRSQRLVADIPLRSTNRRRK
jgi:septum formation topological specificity factor MinE